MPLGWPLSIDGAVRQFYMHKKATIQELDSWLQEFDLRRSSVEINRHTPQWSHNSVWNRRYRTWSKNQGTPYSKCGEMQNLTLATKQHAQLTLQKKHYATM